MSRIRKVILAILGVGVVAFVVLQLLPFGGRTNPPVTYQVNWDSPETESLMRRACYDCHSNETVWPWYAYIAPVSWLVVNDVNDGREALNFSEGTGEMEAGEIMEVVREGEMPPRLYLTMHPDARLSEADQAQLREGLRATFSGAD
jgi:hypothetical protein